MDSRPLIVSSSWRAENFIESHIDSIASQTYEGITAGIYLDECSEEIFQKVSTKIANLDGFTAIYDSDKGCTLQSQHRIIEQFASENSILFWLDGDDRFYDDEVVEYIMNMYNKDPELMLTYGQLVPDPPDPRCPRAMAYTSDCQQNRDFRKASKHGHCFNHLRTMRYSLWKQIPDSYTRWQDGSYFTVAGDAAEIVSGLELTGSRGYAFVNRPNVLYNTSNSLSDWRQDPKGINKTHAYIESLPKLDLL